jgi:hypothetical protein
MTENSSRCRIQSGHIAGHFAVAGQTDERVVDLRGRDPGLVTDIGDAGCEHPIDELDPFGEVIDPGAAGSARQRAIRAQEAQRRLRASTIDAQEHGVNRETGERSHHGPLG